MTKTDQDREAVAYMGKSIADMVIEWVDRADGLGWRVGLQKAIELRLSRLLKERDAHERARAASAPQVEPMAWVNESHRDQIIDRSGSVYWYAPMMCGKKFEGSFPVYLAAPVASHEPASVSSKVGCVSPMGDDTAPFVEHPLAERMGVSIAGMVIEWVDNAEQCDWRVSLAEVIARRVSRLLAETDAPPPEPAKAEVVYDEHRFAVLSANYSRPFLLGAYATLDAAVKAQCGSPENWPIYERRILSAIAAPPTAPAAARSAAEEMRERCAVAAGQRGSTDSPSVWSRGYAAGRLDAAADIRALPLPGEEA